MTALGLSAHAQDFGLNWNTLDGGGGQSHGGAFTLAASIGQPDAGLLAGGSYSLLGGFWGVTLPDPRLRLTHSGNSIVITWPNPAADVVLEETARLEGAATVWTRVGQPPVVVGDETRIALPLGPGRKFYRLARR